jgi:hypothetical protein
LRRTAGASRQQAEDVEERGIGECLVDAEHNAEHIQLRAGQGRPAAVEEGMKS